MKEEKSTRMRHEGKIAELEEELETIKCELDLNDWLLVKIKVNSEEATQMKQELKCLKEKLEMEKINAV